jgi:glycosyltransferase involved in cell wall biosynthesis
MKKVLMIGWELPPFNSGGLGVACFFLAKSLKHKVDLTFALPHYCNFSHMPFKIIFADEFDSPIYPAYASNNDPTIALTGLFDEVLTYGPRLLSRLRQLGLKFDLIHAHDWLSGVAGLYLKNKIGLPLIVHVHATEIERTGGNPNQDIYNLERQIFEQADIVVTVSHLTREIVHNYYQIPRDKIRVVPNGIDLTTHRGRVPFYLKLLRSHGYKIVLFVGRLVLQKGPDYLLKTLPIVANYIPKVKYVFLGSGEMMPELIAEAERLKVLDKVIFAGFLRDAELEGIYQSADLLVAPSVFDPFGLVPLEGIKNGTPVIISKTTGVGNYLAHVLKVDFWDIQLLSNFIICSLKYPCLRQELKSNASQELTKFNWDNRSNTLLEIYTSLKCPQ